MQQIIGHRGAAGSSPENTIASFEKAYALGCRFIEFDVMLSADNEAFIFHDDTLERTTNGQGNFGLSTREYLQSLDAGSWFSKEYAGEKIPTLHDAIHWLVKREVHANIEIKPYPGFTIQTTRAVLEHIERYWPKEKPLPLVSSFCHDALAICREHSKELPLGLLLDKWQDNWLLLAKEYRCTSVHLSRRIATASRVLEIKRQGYIVYVYTVNRERLALKLLSFGVDALFSDYPDLLS